jgi:hypothetical protein
MVGNIGRWKWRFAFQQAGLKRRALDHGYALIWKRFEKSWGEA